MCLNHLLLAATLASASMWAEARETSNAPPAAAAPYTIKEVMVLTRATMEGGTSSVCNVAPDTTECVHRMKAFNAQQFGSCQTYQGWNHSMPLVLLGKVIHAPTLTAGDKAFAEAHERMQMWRDVPKTDANCTAQQWSVLFNILNKSYEASAARVSALRNADTREKSKASACAGTRESQLYQAAATYLMSKETESIAMGTVNKERENLDIMGVNNRRNLQSAAQSASRAKWMAEQALAAYRQLGEDLGNLERWASKDPCK
jgi:hypothetical protein